MKRTSLLIMLVSLAALVVVSQAGAAEICAIALTKGADSVSLSLSFDQLPAYELRDHSWPARAEIVMLKTRLASSVKLPKAAYPVLAVNTFQGAENLSVSIRLPGAYPFEAVEKGCSLILSFPLTFSNVQEIPVMEGTKLSVERASDGKAYYESYYTLLSTGTVASKMRLVVAASHGARTMPLSGIAARENAALAMNAGYFDGGGTPVSLVVGDGLLAALPVKPARASLIVDQAGNSYISRSKLEIWLLADGKRVRVDGFNQAPKDGTIIAYSRLFPKLKLRADAIYYRLTPSELTPISYQQVAQEAFEDYVLALHLSPEADPFKYSRNIAFKWRLLGAGEIEIPVRLAVDGAPMLVEEGRISITTELDQVPKNIGESVRARTAVGFDRQGNLIWFVAREDDESSVPGLSLQELAQRMVQLGAWTALNLDGGGSSEIALFGMPLNMPIEKERKLPVCLVLKEGS